MAKSKSVPSPRIIVVDCSIAHAAGPDGATHPTSRHCREFLIVLRKSCHRLGWSSAVAEEWKQHRSGFARKWLVSMFAHKLVESISATEHAALRSALIKSSTVKKTQDAMLKDAHLLEAAICSDNRVASLDEIVRTLFMVASKTFKPIQGIAWVNPDREHVSVVEWLTTGAPLEASRQLSTHGP